jgi:hypothetical protein
MEWKNIRALVNPEHLDPYHMHFSACPINFMPSVVILRLCLAFVLSLNICFGPFYVAGFFYYFPHPVNDVSRWLYLHFWHSRTVMGHNASHP